MKKREGSTPPRPIMIHNNTELEQWSYAKMCMSSRDSKGKLVTNKTKKPKSKSPLDRKVVSSIFFRSVVYQIDTLLSSAKEILDFRRRDLEEFDHYAGDHQVDNDPEYRHELAREIVYWTRMIEVYEVIKTNKIRWYKEGKFPWSGVKVSTPYFTVPPVSMVCKTAEKIDQDLEMTPVNVDNNQTQFEFKPVSKDGTYSKARRASRNRKSNSGSKRSRV